MKSKKFENLLHFILNYIESRSAVLQGKGWGVSTTNLEVKTAAELLETPPRICIDVGGNEGHYTEALLAKFREAQIIVFEPSKKNAGILRDKFGSDPRVVIEESALSNKDNLSTLYSNGDGSGLASLTKRRLDHHGISFEHSEEVMCQRFENYWSGKLMSSEIDLLKLDIEGHELDALIGMGDAINRVKLIQFEVGGCNIDTRTYFQDFWYFFQSHGFEIFRLGPLGARRVDQYSESLEYFSTTNFYARRLPRS